MSDQGNVGMHVLTKLPTEGLKLLRKDVIGCNFTIDTIQGGKSNPPRVNTCKKTFYFFIDVMFISMAISPIMTMKITIITEQLVSCQGYLVTLPCY